MGIIAGATVCKPTGKLLRGRRAAAAENNRGVGRRGAVGDEGEHDGQVKGRTLPA